MFEFYLLLFLFPLYYSEIIIPVSDLQNVTVSYVEGYRNYTLSYNAICSPIFKDKILIIRTIGSIKSTSYLFVYDDFDKLKKDKEKYSFSNYIFKNDFYHNEEFYQINLNNCTKDKTYYITFDSKSHTSYYKDSFNFIITIFSAISNSYIHQSISFSGKKSYFLFYLPQGNYVNYNYGIGFKKLTNDILGELQILILDDYQLFHQISHTDYFEYYMTKTKTYEKYIVNLTLTSTSQNNNINKIYFYLIKSYNPVKINTKFTYYKEPRNNTQEYIVLKELNLLLDISSVSTYSKVYYEYNWEYSLENSIKTYGYNDINNKDEGEGEREELYLDKDLNCVNDKNMCEDFFRKKSKSLNYVFLKITPLKNNYNDSYNITIKYGYSYEYSSGLPFYSTLIGIALYIPNIIFLCMDNNKFQCYHSSGVYGTLDFFSCLGFQI